MLFEPESKNLESLGVSAPESLVTVDQNGHMLILLHNHQGVCVKLSEGMQLGAVRMCKIPEADPEVVLTRETQESTCTHVSVGGDDSERFQKLLKALDLPESKFSREEMTELKAYLKSQLTFLLSVTQSLAVASFHRHRQPYAYQTTVV